MSGLGNADDKGPRRPSAGSTAALSSGTSPLFHGPFQQGPQCPPCLQHRERQRDIPWNPRLRLAGSNVRHPTPICFPTFILNQNTVYPMEVKYPATAAALDRTLTLAALRSRLCPGPYGRGCHAVSVYNAAQGSDPRYCSFPAAIHPGRL
jgi:hypothetical protein